MTIALRNAIHGHEPYYTSFAIAVGLLFFRVTKEVLYIPLESGLKLKGKIMEVIIVQFLEILILMIPPSIEQFLPFIITGVLSVWIAAILLHDKQLHLLNITS